ncbi:MAG: hypothetical protein GY953_28195 [bacterium]|nr:hypothetical protein [bacterium]
MLRRLDPASDRFLTDMADINRRLEQAQREITSGRRINKPSDRPDQISNVLQMRTELVLTEQAIFNLGRVRTGVDASEQALQAAVGVVERARVLGIQGLNDTQSAETRLMIAGEAEALVQQLVGLSRTTIEARYVFSGDADSVAPYTVDVTLDDPYSAYLGGPVTREVQHPSGSRFNAAKTAEEIFDNADPTRNVFDAVNNLRLGLRNNDQVAIEAAVTQLEGAETHLNRELAFYGAAQNQVAEALDFANKQELRLATRLSEVVDADLTEAIVEFNQTKYQQEVALATKAKMPTTSLFDFLG